MTNATTTARVLLAYQRREKPTFETLCQELHLASKQAVSHHVTKLRHAGLLESVGKRVQLTNAGHLAAELLAAHERGESLWRQCVRRFFGRYTHRTSDAIHREVSRMDAEYALNREGLTIRRAGRRQLERKQSWNEVLRALRRHQRWCDASEALGIQQAALQRRVKLLMEKVKEALEVNVTSLENSVTSEQHKALCDWLPQSESTDALSDF